MPTYDYKCNSCGFKFEAFQSIKAEPLKECPECRGSVERQIGGGIGFISSGSDSSFKGTGSCQTCANPTNCSTCSGN